MGIIHTAKKQVELELIKKKEFIKVEENAAKFGYKKPLTEAEKHEVICDVIVTNFHNAILILDQRTIYRGIKNDKFK